MTEFKIATRGSRLALWQAQYVKEHLEAAHPGVRVSFHVVKTRGDIILDVPLSQVGGKGLFVKEIEDALLTGAADMAVHSMKDVPMRLPDGLELGIVPEREDPADVFLSAKYADFDSLPKDAVVGTSSLRRQAQVLALRPDLRVQTLRGNVDTRLRKLMEGQYDAIVLAAAGLTRLGLGAPFSVRLVPPLFLPAVGQGALGIEFGMDRADLRELLGFMEHRATRIRVEAERGLLAGLEGGCQAPIAGHAVMLDDQTFRLEGMVASLDGRRMARREAVGLADDASSVGHALAQTLLDAGGRELLAEVYSE